MGIKPKFQLGRQEREFIAAKQFTDREYPREVFSKRIDQIVRRPSSEKENDVIMYYGVGGIGKSSLQNQLKIELVNDIPDALYTAIDFMNQSLHSPARALLELVRDIKYKHQLLFPHFEIAYSIYFYKRNPDISYNEKQLPFKSEMTIAASVLSALDGLGVIGAATEIIDKLYATKKKWGLNKEVKEQLKELQSCSLQEMEDRLTAFFAYDLQMAINKNQIPVSVIFLDTYEALWADIKNDATKYTKDEWIRELVALLPNVLFVICGREYLEWEVCNPAWKDIVEQHILGNLDNNDADLFLLDCGIQEEEIREKMIMASNGHPYHLDLSVDTYFEMKNRGEDLHLDQFGSNKREIFDRFLRYLSDEEIETLKIMSIPRFYDRDIFNYLISNFKTGYPVTKFNDFNKFSFITREQNRHYIHTLMGEGMLEYSSEELIQQVHISLADYYADLLENNSSVLTDNEKELIIFEENIYHQCHMLAPKEFAVWLETNRLSYLKKYQLRGEIRVLRNLLNKTFENMKTEDISTSLFSILIDMIHLNGNYELAEQKINEYYGTAAMEDIIKSKEDLHLLIRKVHHQMFFRPVKPLIEELQKLQLNISAEFVDEYNEVLFMLGGNLGVLHGNLDFSRKWLVNSIRFAKSTGRMNYLCRALRKYADVLRLKGHLKWAEQCAGIGLQLSRENGFERYESYLLCTLGDIFRAGKKYEEASALFEQANAIIKQHGIKGWEGHVNAALAEMAFQTANYYDSAKYYTLAHAIYVKVNQQWGIIVSSLGLAKCKLEGVDLEVPLSIEEIIEQASLLNYEREKAFAEEIATAGKSQSMPLIFL